MNTPTTSNATTRAAYRIGFRFGYILGRGQATVRRRARALAKRAA